jgi:16S rRNA (adenine1518-N6/adenine1519-N6)-dimethyltransferase
MIQYNCRVIPLIPVPPESFSPAPKVQSALVRLKPYSEKPYNASDEILLSTIVKLCFQQRRKTLRNCLKPYGNYLSSIGQVINLTSRPEELSIRDFVDITNIIDQLKDEDL